MKARRRNAVPPLDPDPLNPQPNAEVLATSYEKQFSPHFPPPARSARLFKFAHDNTPTLPSGPDITISPKNVTDIIKHLKNRAPGPDRIPNFALKMLPPPTIDRLTNLYNTVFRLRHFPAPWKIARIVPVPKPGKNPKLPDSYRPISLLNTTSKILESLILDKINDHVTDHNLLNQDQFGFRRGHSTTLQLCRIADVVTTNLSNRRITAMVSLDLSKAFDTIYQDALIFRLHKLDVPVRLVQLIHSYLSHRTFYVHCNNISSSRHPITAGVPQGSALGPLLFSLYINNIPKPTDHRIFNAIYADDTAVVATSYCPDVLQNILQPHLDRLDGFFLRYGLKVNPDKCQAIVFSTRRDIAPPNLTLSNAPLRWIKTIKYLGVTLDSRLTFQHHIKMVKQKAVCRILAIRKFLRSPNLSLEAKLTLYKALIRPIVTYASPAWCTIYQSQFDIIEPVQNRALRYITNSPTYLHIPTLRRSAGSIESLQEHIRTLNRSFYKKLTSDPDVNPTLTSLLTAKYSSRSHYQSKKRKRTQDTLEDNTRRDPKRPRH